MLIMGVICDRIVSPLKNDDIQACLIFKKLGWFLGHWNRGHVLAVRFHLLYSSLISQFWRNNISQGFFFAVQVFSTLFCFSKFLNFRRLLERYSQEFVRIQLLKKLASNWLVSSLDRALHRYRRGHGFKSREYHCIILVQIPYRSEFFSGLVVPSSVHDCEDYFYIHFSIRSSHDDFYIFTVIYFLFICEIFANYLHFATEVAKYNLTKRPVDNLCICRYLSSLCYV